MSLFDFLRMEKTNAKVIIYALLPLLLLQFSSPAGAVDIIFFEEYDSCSGTVGMGFHDIPDLLCCEVDASIGGSVLIRNTSYDDVDASYVYGGGGCSTKRSGPETTDYCYTGGNYTGAYYFRRATPPITAPIAQSPRRSLLADPTTYDTRMEPNIVTFTEDSTQGLWILITPNIHQIYSELKTVPDAEKANWLKARGAVYDQL